MGLTSDMLVILSWGWGTRYSFDFYHQITRQYKNYNTKWVNLGQIIIKQNTQLPLAGDIGVVKIASPPLVFLK